MTREKAIARLTELAASQGHGDTDAEHKEADDILCDLLIDLGYADVVTLWKQVHKWYA